MYGYAWVVYGLALLALVFLVYWRFVFSLSAVTRMALMVSPLVFISGAVGMELLGAAVEGGVLEDFPSGLSWNRAIAIEEFCEMAGIITLIFGLNYHRAHVTDLVLPELSSA